ncbi:MAG: DUF368 domain-containing protein [Firmicutes bacterium]|nr:DUF368 domain-containing protein [Bacillota bacterium]
MKEKLILMIKGFFFGIANIIPGVSGGTMALTMGVYEEMIEVISHFFKDIKKSLNFVIPFGVGALLSILLISKLISKALDKFPFPTTLFFIGLILGGIPLLTRKVRKVKIKPLNIIIFLITFGLIIGMSIMNEGSNVVNISNLSLGMYCLLFLVGIIAAATMVIPGVSGSFVLMLLGFYKPIVDTVSSITDFSLLGHNILVLMPFGLGVLIGIVLVSRLIEFLFKKFEVSTYYAVLGFVLASVITLLISLFGCSISIIQVLVGLVLFIVATLIGYKLGDA